MPVPVDYEVPTWSQIYDMLLNQAKKIGQTPKPDIVVGVARGGVVSARILMDLLETSQLATVQVEFYVDIAQPTLQPTLKQPLSVSVVGKRLLLVDDIADSGQSLKLAKSHLQNRGASQIQTATLYLKPHSTFTPDFYEKETCNWVVFPWDVKETLRKIVTRQLGRREQNQEVAKLVKAGLPKQLTQKLLKDIEQEPPC